MTDQHPSRLLDKIVIRVPEGMKGRIHRAAKENGRSVNAELVVLLEEQYPPEPILDECVLGIVAAISKLPESNQNDAWRNVFDKLDKARGGR